MASAQIRNVQFTSPSETRERATTRRLKIITNREIAQFIGAHTYLRYCSGLAPDVYVCKAMGWIFVTLGDKLTQMPKCLVWRIELYRVVRMSLTRSYSDDRGPR